MQLWESSKKNDKEERLSFGHLANNSSEERVEFHSCRKKRWRCETHSPDAECVCREEEGK